MRFLDWRHGLEQWSAVQLFKLYLCENYTGEHWEIFFFPSCLNLLFCLKQSRLWRAEAMRNNSFLQARTVVMLLLLLTDRLTSCQVIHRQEMGSLLLLHPEPSLVSAGSQWEWLFLQMGAEVSFLVVPSGVYLFWDACVELLSPFFSI